MSCNKPVHAVSAHKPLLQKAAKCYRKTKFFWVIVNYHTATDRP